MSERKTVAKETVSFDILIMDNGELLLCGLKAYAESLKLSMKSLSILTKALADAENEINKKGK